MNNNNKKTNWKDNYIPFAEALPLQTGDLCIIRGLQNETFIVIDYEVKDGTRPFAINSRCPITRKEDQSFRTRKVKEHHITISIDGKEMFVCECKSNLTHIWVAKR